MKPSPKPRAAAILKALKLIEAKRKSRKPSPQPKPDTSLVSEMLTPSEIDSLQQHARESIAYFQKAFAEKKPPTLR